MECTVLVTEMSQIQYNPAYKNKKSKLKYRSLYKYRHFLSSFLLSFFGKYVILYSLEGINLYYIKDKVTKYTKNLLFPMLDGFSLLYVTQYDIKPTLTSTLYEMCVCVLSYL